MSGMVPRLRACVRGLRWSLKRDWLPAPVVGLLVLLAGPVRLDAVCSITGASTIDCDGVSYQAGDDECIDYVDLAQHNASHPGVPLPTLRKTVAANYAADAVPTPVVVALTDFVNCTLTDHNFS